MALIGIEMKEGVVGLASRNLEFYFRYIGFGIIVRYLRRVVGK